MRNEKFEFALFKHKDRMNKYKQVKLFPTFKWYSEIFYNLEEIIDAQLAKSLLRLSTFLSVQTSMHRIKRTLMI